MFSKKDAAHEPSIRELQKSNHSLSICCTLIAISQICSVIQFAIFRNNVNARVDHCIQQVNELSDAVIQMSDEVVLFESDMVSLSEELVSFLIGYTGTN